MKIKKGNSVVLKITIKDSLGAVITTLASATAMTFLVKSNMTDLDADAYITKSLTSGITIYDADNGIIKVTLDSTDTDIGVATYYFGLQITWATSTQEITFKENFEEINTFDIVQEVVIGA